MLECLNYVHFLTAVSSVEHEWGNESLNKGACDFFEMPCLVPASGMWDVYLRLDSGHNNISFEGGVGYLEFVVWPFSE